MEINPTIFRATARNIPGGIFRAYDIRGIYPDEINKEVAYLVGRAFVEFLKRTRSQPSKRLNIVVGRDNRISSPILFKSLVQGIIDWGGNIIDIGLSTTPMLYWASAHYKFDGGIEISASHNPPKYNGFKIVREKAIPIGSETGLKKIRYFVRKLRSLPAKPAGKIFKKKILSEYIKFNLKRVDLTKISPLRLVVDTGNGITGIVVPEIFKKIPCQTYFLFLKLDGNFPNHLPDPMIKRNLRFLQKKVKEIKANLGIAFDGDGDRILFVDEKGKIVSPDLIFALISSLILKSNPGQKILYTVPSSRIIRETIEAKGGKPVLTRVGHTFIKEKMRKENIIFAGEASGHYALAEDYFSENPFFVLFKILQELSQTKKSLSELIRPFKKYFYSGEINFEVENKEKILTNLEKKYKKGRISKTDGLRVDFKNWWFNLRPSQTEPLLRLVIETETKELMEKKKRELAKLISKRINS